MKRGRQRSRFASGKASRTPVALAVAALVATSVSGMIIVIPLFILRIGTVSEPSSSYAETSMVPLTYTSVATIDVPGAIAAFDYPFGSSGSVPFSVAWRAPEGRAIEIRAPTGFDSVAVFFVFGGGTFLEPSGSFADNSATVEYEGLQGSVSTATGTVSLSGPVSSMSTPRVHAAVSLGGLDPGQRILMREVRVSTTVPVGYNTDFDGVPVTVFHVRGNADAFGSPGSFPPDPGQWVRLVTDPAIVKAGLRRQIAKLKRQIRKAKKKGDRNRVGKLTRKLKRLQRRLAKL